MNIIERLGAIVTLVLVSILIMVTPTSAQGGPIAHITFPIMGQTIRGDISIQGTATSQQFARYTVAYAPEPDQTNWTVINVSTIQQPNGMLAVWNTEPLPDGKYALRLQVTNNDGTAVQALIRDIDLANATATATASASSSAVVTDTASTSNSFTNALGFDPVAMVNSLDLSAIPGAFVKGMRYTLYAFAALAVYVLVKRIIGSLLHRLFHKPEDYGR